MILTAHQPVYLPWLGLFHKIAISDVYCYFDDVQYLSSDWNNRNKIKIQDCGRWLTVPVLRHGYLCKTIKEMKINNTVDWRKKHWMSIYLNYKKAPYFDDYAGFFEDTYKKEWQYLSDLNEYMLKWFLKVLNINVKYYKASELDLKGKKSDLVLYMCQKLKADTYVFGALGKDYANERDFKKNNVKVYFQNYQHPIYQQLRGDFLPYMSIVDLLFNCGDKSAEIVMAGNISKEELLRMI